jgi:hypothetical protein
MKLMAHAPDTVIHVGIIRVFENCFFWHGLLDVMGCVYIDMCSKILLCKLVTYNFKICL